MPTKTTPAPRSSRRPAAKVSAIAKTTPAAKARASRKTTRSKKAATQGTLLSRMGHTFKVSKFVKAHVTLSLVLLATAVVSGVWSLTVDHTKADSVTASYNETSSTFGYSGTWTKSKDNLAYLQDYRITNAKGATYKLTFTGTQIRFYSEMSTRMGIMGVSIDGGPEQEVDSYRSNTASAHQVLTYTSPVLPSKKHVVTVRVTGKKNPAATNTYIVADRVNITRDTQAAGNPPVTGSTYYVAASNGSDAANGSSAMPWKTIQKAVNSAPAGATIRVKAGTYAPFTVNRPGLTITNSGKAIVKGTATTRHIISITASNTKLSGLTVSGCVPNATGNSGVYIGGTTNVTVSKMTISDSHGKNSYGLPVGCYGISTIGANSFTLSDNDIHHNGSGINISSGGQNSKLLNNKVHDNDVIIWNTPKSVNDNDDYGGVGITFDNITANPGPLAQGNSLYNNAGPSQDYTDDGGGFEIFKSSNVRMISNKIYNNDNIIETGTDGSALCSNNVFSGNTASGKTSGSKLKISMGMILRCNKNMSIDKNTLGPVDSWMFDIETGGAYGSSVDGLKITNNKVTMKGGAAVYAISVNPAGRGFTFSGNKYRHEGAFAWGWNNNTIKTLADWQKATGLDKNSTKF